jgi:hypothetical protein
MHHISKSRKVTRRKKNDKQLNKKMMVKKNSLTLWSIHINTIQEIVGFQYSWLVHDSLTAQSHWGTHVQECP